jgi:uncharacterized protein
MTAEAKASWRFAAVVSSLAIAFALAVPQYLRRYTIPPRSVLAIYCSFVLLLAFIVAPAISVSRPWIATCVHGRKRQFALIPVWCLPYLIYAAGTGDFQWNALLRLLLVAAVVLFIYVLFPVTDNYKFGWQDAAVAVWLMSAVLFHQLRGIWNIPTNLDFMTRLFVIAVGAWTWMFVRPVPRSGYEISISKRVLKAATFNFACFAVIAIPASLAMHFTALNPRWPGAAAFCLNFLELFVFVAWLEELFFRGFLQNLLSNSLGYAWRGHLIASVLFGLSHIFHAPVPNWRYVALASLAGWFYGAAFRSGGNLIASSLTHALVDTAWRTWFSRV